MTGSFTGRSPVTTGDPAVAERHRRWTFGWERQEGDPAFRFEMTFGEYYDSTFDAVILYDDFDPQHRVAYRPAEYGAIWEPSFNALRSAHHVIVDGPHAVSSGGLAASTLVFVARIEQLSGTVTGIRTTSLAWRLGEDGWRIIREHNSSVVIPVEEAERLLSTPTA